MVYVVCDEFQQIVVVVVCEVVFDDFVDGVDCCDEVVEIFVLMIGQCDFGKYDLYVVEFFELDVCVVVVDVVGFFELFYVDQVWIG